MIVFKDHISYLILGKEVNVISEYMEYGYNTVVEIDNTYHYLGPNYPDIATAIAIWQKINGKELTLKEIDQVLMDNNLISGAV